MKKRLSALLIMLLPFQVFATPIDIVFLLDRSGSVTQEGWDLQTSYIDSLIDSLTYVERNISLVSFASDVTTHHSFSDEQTYSALSTALYSINYSHGRTHTKSGINASLDVFAADSKNNKKHIVMFTDGNPTSHRDPQRDQSVCRDSAMKDKLDASGVGMTVVGIGTNWNSDTLTCLVDDSTSGLIYANDFQLDSLNSVSVNIMRGIGFGNYQDFDQSACTSGDLSAIYKNNKCYQVTIPEPQGIVLFAFILMLSLLTAQQRLGKSS